MNLPILACSSACLLAVASISHAAYIDEVLASSPYAYYRFDETTITAGSLANDASPNGRDGTYINTPAGGQTGALTSDPTSTGIFFDGSDTEYVSAPALNALGNTLELGFTYEAWISTTTPITTSTSGTGNNQTSLFGGANDGTTTNVAVAIRDNLATTTPGDIRFLIRSDNGNNRSASVTSAPGLFDGNYHHLVLTYSGTAGGNAMSIYIDGVARTVNLSSNVTFNNFSTFQWEARVGTGGRQNPDAQKYNGRMDEVAIYNRALSAAEVQSHYAAGTIPEPSLGVLSAVGAALLGFRRRRA